jgi:predicted enzyme related to lactoylglutathione lyase
MLKISTDSGPIMLKLFIALNDHYRRTFMRVLSAIVACFVLSSILFGVQAPAQNPTNKTGVIGLMHAIHSTNDIDKTMAFYRDVFALNGQVSAFDPKGPRILTNSPTATLRYAMTNLRGAFSFELTQFADVERQLNKQPDIQDPGAPIMKILVRDLDAVVLNAKKANAPILTKGGAPIMAPTPIGNARAIVMRDPDGYFIEAIQATPADIAATDRLPQTAGRGGNANANAPVIASPIVGAILGVTVRDMDETLKYWNDVLGMEMPKAGNFSNDSAMLNLMGLPSDASYRISAGVISGSTARIEFIEFKGVPRKPFDLRVTDAMACGMALRIGHIQDLLAKIKANGGRVMSRNEELVEWNATTRNVFVKDPNGLNLEQVGSADPNL